MFELILYLGFIAYLTKLLLLDHQHYFLESATDVFIEQFDDVYKRKFDIADRFRQKIFSYELVGQTWIIRHSSLSQLFLCPYCLSFWLNLILMPILSIISDYPSTYYLLFVFAIPYIVGFLHER